MKNVTYCKNSTITEAWALIQGLPAPLNDIELNAIVHSAISQVPQLKTRPTLVVTPNLNDLTPPFWRTHLAWLDDMYQARIGHRYLSVHFSKIRDNKYETYSESLKPQVKKWLDLYAKVLNGKKEDYPIGKIGFGYLNTFEFGRQSFDVSEHFKINLGIDIGEVKGGLQGIKSMFRFFDEARNISISIELSIEESMMKSDSVLVVAHVIAEKSNLDGLSFFDTEKILNELQNSKDVAKKAFFEFATDSTHKKMGAQYASDSATEKSL